MASLGPCLTDGYVMLANRASQYTFLPSKKNHKEQECVCRFSFYKNIFKKKTNSKSVIFFLFFNFKQYISEVRTIVIRVYMHCSVLRGFP